MNRLKLRVSLAFVVGGIVGVCIMGAFFLDPIEQVGWSMFWRGLGQGRVMNLEMVIQSATFMKCLISFLIVGAATGSIVYFKGKREPSPN